MMISFWTGFLIFIAIGVAMIFLTPQFSPAVASMALKRPAPKSAVIAIGKSSGGNAKKTSEIRIKIVSALPPK